MEGARRVTPAEARWDGRGRGSDRIHRKCWAAHLRLVFFFLSFQASLLSPSSGVMTTESDSCTVYSVMPQRFTRERRDRRAAQSEVGAGTGKGICRPCITIDISAMRSLKNCVAFLPEHKDPIRAQPTVRIPEVHTCSRLAVTEPAAPVTLAQRSMVTVECQW